MKPKLLVLCTGNSARSQMAEGLLRHRFGEMFDVESAGTKPSLVRPEAIAVMHELGIDLSGHRSKHLDEFLGTPFQYVITVCDNAAEACPLFPGPAQRLHWPFPDPAHLAGTEAERQQAFREVRDMIAKQVDAWQPES